MNTAMEMSYASIVYETDDDNEGSPESMLKSSKLQYIHVRSQDGKHSLIYVDKPFCSFMETTAKLQLLNKERKIISRNIQGDLEATLIIDLIPTDRNYFIFVIHNPGDEQDDVRRVSLDDLQSFMTKDFFQLFVLKMKMGFYKMKYLLNDIVQLITNPIFMKLYAKLVSNKENLVSNRKPNHLVPIIVLSQTGFNTGLAQPPILQYNAGKSSYPEYPFGTHAGYCWIGDGLGSTRPPNQIKEEVRPGIVNAHRACQTDRAQLELANSKLAEKYVKKIPLGSKVKPDYRPNESLKPGVNVDGPKTSKTGQSCSTNTMIQRESSKQVSHGSSFKLKNNQDSNDPWLQLSLGPTPKKNKQETGEPSAKSSLAPSLSTPSIQQKDPQVQGTSFYYQGTGYNVGAGSGIEVNQDKGSILRVNSLGELQHTLEEQRKRKTSRK